MACRVCCPRSYSPQMFALALAAVADLPTVAARAQERAPLCSTVGRSLATMARAGATGPAQQALTAVAEVVTLVPLDLSSPLALTEALVELQEVRPPWQSPGSGHSGRASAHNAGGTAHATVKAGGLAALVGSPGTAARARALDAFVEPLTTVLPRLCTLKKSRVLAAVGSTLLPPSPPF